MSEGNCSTYGPALVLTSSNPSAYIWASVNTLDQMRGLLLTYCLSESIWDIALQFAQTKFIVIAISAQALRWIVTKIC